MFCHKRWTPKLWTLLKYLKPRLTRTYPSWQVINGEQNQNSIPIFPSYTNSYMEDGRMVPTDSCLLLVTVLHSIFVITTNATRERHRGHYQSHRSMGRNLSPESSFCWIFSPWRVWFSLQNVYDVLVVTELEWSWSKDSSIPDNGVICIIWSDITTDN